jgi:DNA-binding GntR family transcriptional regulator
MGLEALHRDDARTPQALQEHRLLMQAVAARDADAARTIVDTHIGTTLALLRGRPLSNGDQR